MQNSIIGLAHIGVFSKDLEVSKAFYCDRLGFKVIHENAITETDGVVKIAFVAAGNCVIELIQKPQHQAKDSGIVDHIALNVKDIEKVWTDLKAEGIKFETPEIVTNLTFFEKGSRWITFWGPDGERLELNETL